MNGNGFRRLPIGVQGFMSLRGDGFLYVDKTEYIYRLARGSRQYFLSRPRRFGKSLLLSTLRAYWEGRKELFKGLAIERLEEENAEAWQPYPVFYFDLNKDSYQKNGILEEVLADTTLFDKLAVEIEHNTQTVFRSMLRGMGLEPQFIE